MAKNAQGKKKRKDCVQSKGTSSFITSFSQPFRYEGGLIESRIFKEVSLFAIFNNPFAETTLFRPNLSESFKRELEKNGELGKYFSSHFAGHLWTHDNLLSDNPEWNESPVCSAFGKTFSYEFVYMSKSGSKNGRFGDFFTHVRNAFAHGRFATLSIGKERYWFFEDISSGKASKHLTARICISETFICELIQMIRNGIRSHLDGGKL